MRIRTRYITSVIELTVFVLLFAGLASAQSQAASTDPGNTQTHRALGYVFAAPGVYIGNADSVATLHLGGGAEARVYRGLGIGAEIGGIAALQGSGGGLGLFSVNGSYHFEQKGKVSPFLTWGYSIVSGSGTRNLINFGGGVNYWLREGKGIRLEVRDHYYMDGSGRQLLGFRIGFTFH